MTRSLHIRVILAVAEGFGVEVVLYPDLEPCRPTYAEDNPVVNGWAVPRMVYMGEPDDPEAMWLDLLHEVGHAALGVGRRLGSEIDTLAWSLLVVWALWGLTSEESQQMQDYYRCVGEECVGLPIATTTIDSRRLGKAFDLLCEDA